MNFNVEKERCVFAKTGFGDKRIFNGLETKDFACGETAAGQTGTVSNLTE